MPEQPEERSDDPVLDAAADRDTDTVSEAPVVPVDGVAAPDADGDAVAVEDRSTDATDQDAAEAGAPDGESQGPRKLALVAVVAVVALVADQATKIWAQSALSDGRIIDVVGSLRFNLLYNTGVAFSQGSGQGLGPWISVLALGVVITVSLGATSRQRLGAVASGLISGGAVGNLIDRAFRGDDGFLHGGVIDFIDLQWWPVFNIADAAVVVGAGLLVVASFQAPR